MIPTAAVRRFNNFRTHTTSLFKKRSVPSNLLHHQHLALRHLQLQNEFLIIQCDKNLGPAIIEYTKYVQRALSDHLTKRDTYRQLSNIVARKYVTRIDGLILQWLKKYRTSMLSS